MKKSFIFAAAIAVLCGCTAGKNAYTISGESTADSVYLLDMTGRNVIDSCKVSDGKFSFKGTADTLSMVIVTDNVSYRDADLLAVAAVEPGDIVVEKVTDENGDSYQVKGTPANDASIAFNETVKPLLDEYYDPETTAERKEAIGKEYDAAALKSVDENLTNLFGLQQIQNLVGDSMSYRDAIAKYETFSDQVKATKQWKDAYERVNKLAAIAEGPYQDFEQESLAEPGTSISLKSVVERADTKYVLLDFWASWCRPCMGEVPYMVEVYAQYKDKGFEIFGSSLDKDREKWAAAVKDNKMDWVHVSDLQQWNNAGAALYEVHSIPANFLIDCATGKIIATNLRGDALKAKIAELLD